MSEVCHCCGKDLTDPKNAGDPDVQGQWVCRDEVCRAVHDVEMTVTLDDHQIKSDDNVVADCLECGAYLTHDEKVERSEGTYCESCAPRLVTDGGTQESGEQQKLIIPTGDRVVLEEGGGWKEGYDKIWKPNFWVFGDGEVRIPVDRDTRAYLQADGRTRVYHDGRRAL